MPVPVQNARKAPGRLRSSRYCLTPTVERRTGQERTTGLLNRIDDQGEDMGEPLASVDRELTDEELIEVWESTVSGVRDGSIVTFDDKSALIEDVKRRLGQQ